MRKPMVKVHLWAGLRALTGGQDVIEVEAHNVLGLYRALVAAYPALGPVINDGDGVSISIDGVLIPDAGLEKISKTSEIYLLQRNKGG